MKILVIGGTGHVGQLTAKRAIAQGHSVTAFGRSPEKIDWGDHALTPYKGDVLVPGDVLDAVKGHDAVVLTFGATPSRETVLHEPDLCKMGTAHVVTAMQAHGVTRLVAMTSLGAGDSSGHGRLVFKALIEPIMLGRIMADKTEQEAEIRRSSVAQWVIVRPTELSDGEPAPVRTITDLDREDDPTRITRASVAHRLVELLNDRSHDGSAVVITN